MTGLVSKAYAKIIELGTACGARRIDQLPGCWSRDFGSGWCVAVNGHDTPTEHDGVSVPPFEAFVWWQGWPAGSIGLGGGIIAAGEAVNEAAFIRAIDAEIEAVTGRPPQAMGDGEGDETTVEPESPLAEPKTDPFAGLPDIFRACVEREMLGKTDIRTPWQEQGKIFATNGRILVTVPAVGPLADYPSPAPGRKVPKDVPGHFAGWEAAGYKPEPVELPGEIDGRPLVELEMCPECKGEGWVLVGPEPYEAHVCGLCDGEKTVRPTTPIDLGGVLLAEHYVALLRRHNAKVFRPTDPGTLSELRPVRFEVGEHASGFLMPLNPQYVGQGDQ